MERRCAALSTAGFRAFDFQIDHDRILTATYDDSFAGFVGASVDLLVRHLGGNIDEITRPCLTAEFQVVSPSHAGPAPNDVKHGFQVAVVVGTCLRVWLDYYGRRSQPLALGLKMGVEERGDAAACVEGGWLVVGDVGETQRLEEDALVIVHE